jgi:hypothetical protein
MFFCTLNNKPRRASILPLLSVLCYLSGQEAKSTPPIKEPAAQENAERAPFNCSHPAAEQERLMREAVKNQYTIRRVEFLGNKYTRDHLLRQRIPLLQEGNILTRENLIRSLKSVSRLKRIIHPVKLSDVFLHLDRQEKVIDMEICFREKRRSRHGTKLPA